MSLNIDDFISDSLHRVLGLSDKTMVLYIKSLTQSSKSKATLLDGMTDLGMQKDEKVTRFVDDLYDRFGAGGFATASGSMLSGIPSGKYAAEEKRKAAQVAKNSSYSLIGLTDLPSTSSTIEPALEKKLKVEDSKEVADAAKKKDIEERNEIDRKIREKDLKR